MTESNNIPKHWQLKKLGEVCNIRNGKNQKAVVNPNGKYPIYGSAGIMGYADEYLCGEGATIIGRKGTINRPIYVRTKFWNVDTAFGFSPFIELIESRFLFFFCQSFNFHKLDKSTTIPSLAKSDLQKIELPIPPLPEQLTIVSKIEELFSELDNGIAQLKTAQQQLKIYRQSLLKWAFEGKLTNKNVKDGELPKGWKWVRMGDVCEKIQDGSHFSPQVQYDEPGENRFKYITAKNIRNNYMDFRKVIYVDKEYHDSIYGRCNPEFGDVLLTKDGINTGEVTLNTLYEPFSLLSSVCLFKTKKKDLISSYLKYFIQSPFGNKAILDSMTGTAIKRIVLRKIKDAKIILPPLSEQQLIVDELESKLTVCDKIKETITQSLQQAETLRQSILKKAFEGKLIKTKP